MGVAGLFNIRQYNRTTTKTQFDSLHTINYHKNNEIKNILYSPYIKKDAEQFLNLWVNNSCGYLNTNVLISKYKTIL